MVWAWGVSLPVIFVNADPGRTNPAFTVTDAVGCAMWAIGFGVEVVADLQKDAFRADPANKGKWCATGVWAWSRHPNFFGEILLWWGIFVLASSQFAVSDVDWGLATLVSPLLTMAILLCFSGMPTAEGANQLRFMKTPEQRARFEEYRARTSPLIPLPPCLYRSLPVIIKRWLLFEWSIYEAPAAAQPTENAMSSGGS